MIYLIGSLRNPEIPEVGQRLRKELDEEVFDDWFSAGPDADDYLYKYEKSKGNNCVQALKGYAAKHIFEFDKFHLERADRVILLLPAGKSGHLELGWALGQGKKGYIIYKEEPDRIDIMYQFTSNIFKDVDEVIERIKYEKENLWT